MIELVKVAGPQGFILIKDEMVGLLPNDQVPYDDRAVGVTVILKVTISLLDESYSIIPAPTE